MKTIYKTIMGLAALATVGLPASVSAIELKGAPDAVERIESMIDRLGGEDIWSESTSIYIEYRGWRSRPAQAVDERAWRDFHQPNQYLVFEGRLSDTIFHMTDEASWLEFSERDPHVFSAEDHADNLAFWDYDFYTIIHNLARGDDRISVSMDGPRTVRLTGPDDSDWGWFEIDDTGQPVRWGAKSGDEDLEYIYGPVKRYGNVNFPAWGTSVDGYWRFEYTDVDVSRVPIDKELVPPTG